VVRLGHCHREAEMSARLPTGNLTTMRNAMTVDVEDYFQVSAMASHFPRDDWDSIPCRVEMNVDRLLNLFAESDTRATFFTLGWIAQRYPNLVRRIVDTGHELASHGYAHLRATEQSPADFLDDVTRAKKLLETHDLHVSDIARSGSKGGLFEQASRVRGGDWSWWGSCWRGSSGATATASTGGEGNQCTNRRQESCTARSVPGPAWTSTTPGRAAPAPAR